MELVSSTDCLLTDAGACPDRIEVMTDAGGDADIGAVLAQAVEARRGIAATATDADGNSSGLSDCVPMATELVFADGFGPAP